jgi:hypothetical protein
MAETKTKAAASRSGRSGARSASKPSSRQSATTRSRQSANGRSSQARSRNGRRTTSRSTTQRRQSSGRSRAEQRRSESLLTKVTDKAKVPAIAAGAALAGVAGGVLVGRNGKTGGMNLPRKSMLKVLASGAKEIGKAGYKIGQLTSEVRKVREAVSESSKD